MARKKYKILVVDDEEVVCDLLKEGLNSKGYLCTAVTSSREALLVIGQTDFDVLLLDIKLPGMSGLEMLEQMKQRDIIIIMITGVNDVDTAVSAMKLGASDYIVKPFDIDKMDTCIRTTIKTREQDKQSSQIDAIAGGVEAMLDPVSAYSRMVMERTSGIAHLLGIPNSDIKKWEAERENLNTKKRNLTKFLS